MAHEITSTDNMVSANGIVPWHGLGTVVDGMLTAGQAIEAAGLGWDVVQEPLFDADMNIIASHILNRRSDTGDVLGVVGKDWRPIQNSFLVEIAESLGQASEEVKPVIETAGSLRGGKIVWAMITTGEREFAGSAHKSYLLLTNGHDGSRAVRGTMTDVRVVCNNTLSYAETASSQLFVRHSKNVSVRLQDAIEMLGWASDTTRATFALYRALHEAPLCVDEVAYGFRLLTPKYCNWTEDSPLIPEAVDQMVHLFRNGAGNEGKTAFDAVNAVTDWVDHHRRFADGNDVGERRFLYTTSGMGASMKRGSVSMFSRMVGVAQ